MRIAIVEDHCMFAELLAKICRQELKAEVVLNTADAVSAAAAIQTARPDLVILDLGFPGADGLDLAQEIKASLPQTRILIVSCRCDPVTLTRLASVPVDGFIDKQERCQVADLAAAIREVANGGTFYSPVVVRMRLALAQDPKAFYRLLSPAEQKTLSLFGAGLDDAEAAAKLGLRPSTVQSRRRDIMRKLEIHTTPKLIRYAVAQGFTQAEDFNGG